MYVVDASGSSVSAHSLVSGGTSQAGTITSAPVLDCSGSAVWVAWAPINGAAVTVAAIDGSGAVKLSLEYNASAGREKPFDPAHAPFSKIEIGKLGRFGLAASSLERVLIEPSSVVLKPRDHSIYLLRNERLITCS